MPVPSLPSRCILIQMAIRCKFTEVQRERQREETDSELVHLMGLEERGRDWLGEHLRDLEGENRGMRDGWMDGWRRKRGEINMALIVSSAPPLSLYQPFISPLRSVQRRHFGKWGPPLTRSTKTAATHVGVCLIQRGRQIVCACVWMFEWVSTCMTYKEMRTCLSADEFVSLPDGLKKKKGKNPNTFFIFISFGPTPSISCGKSNGKSSAIAFCMMLTLICTLVWKASRHHVEN